VENQTKAPTTLSDVENIEVSSLTGQNFRLKDISAIRQEEQNASILRVNGQTLNVIQAQLVDKYANNQAVAAQVSQALIDFYGQNDGEKLKNLGFEEGDLKVYSEGGSADFANSLIELLRALVLAIIFSYVVLVLFFNSFSQPLVILYTIPLTFIGIFPAIAHLSNGQFGFLEIIGLIILIGVVENVAIFLLDYANQRVAEGLDEKEAISLGSAIRLRPVLMTTFTAIASLAPLAFLSDIYRPISLVIIFGLLTSGFLSLITTPILYIFFRQIHRKIFGRKYN
jgi:HAE1 family hydrophobic/amphiphilic exporter-1